jgi:hypothetical protein
VDECKSLVHGGVQAWVGEAAREEEQARELDAVRE